MTATPHDHAVLGRLVQIFKSADRPEAELKPNLGLFRKVRIIGRRVPAQGERSAATGACRSDEDVAQVGDPVDDVRGWSARASAWDAMPENGGQATLKDIACAVESRSTAEQFLVFGPCFGVGPTLEAGRTVCSGGVAGLRP